MTDRYRDGKTVYDSIFSDVFLIHRGPPRASRSDVESVAINTAKRYALSNGIKTATLQPGGLYRRLGTRDEALRLEIDETY